MQSRRAYLAAMGIDVWRLRAAGPHGPERPAVERSVAPVETASRAATSVPERAPAAAPRGSARLVVREQPARDARAFVAPTPADDRGDIGRMEWDALEKAVAACRACTLHAGRTQTVFGVGDRNAEWMFVGEAPGAEEDRQGEPFVGRAGQLLNSILFAMGMSRERVYIANILKCRPPANRDPLPEEARCCRPFLNRQIALIAPKIIVGLGRIAAQQLLETDTPIGRLRGRLHHYELEGRRIPLVVTYHPAYLLRSPLEKAKVWTDLQFARQAMTGSAS
jgi:DNA polymerase